LCELLKRVPSRGKVRNGESVGIGAIVGPDGGGGERRKRRRRRRSRRKKKK